MDVGVGIQRQRGAVDVAGDLHVAAVAVVGAGGCVPAGDLQVIAVRARGDGGQVQHGLGAAVEADNADTAARVGRDKGADGVVDSVHHRLHPGAGLVGDGAGAVFILAPGHAGRKIKDEDDVNRGGCFLDELGGGCQRRVGHKKIRVVFHRDAAGVAGKGQRFGRNRFV